MLGGGGDEVSIMSVFNPRGPVSILSLIYFPSHGYSYKPSHYLLTPYIGALHIQEYFKNKRGNNRKFIDPHK